MANSEYSTLEGMIRQTTAENEKAEKAERRARRNAIKIGMILQSDAEYGEEVTKELRNKEAHSVSIGEKILQHIEAKNKQDYITDLACDLSQITKHAFEKECDKVCKEHAMAQSSEAKEVAYRKALQLIDMSERIQGAEPVQFNNVDLVRHIVYECFSRKSSLDLSCFNDQQLLMIEKAYVSNVLENINNLEGFASHLYPQSTTSAEAIADFEDIISQIEDLRGLQAESMDTIRQLEENISEQEA